MEAVRIRNCFAGAAVILLLTTLSFGALVSYWDFNEGSGSVLYDVVGSNHGALYDGTNVFDGGSGGNGPTYIAGREGAGTALNFNADYIGGVVANVDCVKISSREDFNVGRGDFTLSGWFNVARSADAPAIGMIFDDGKHGVSGKDVYIRTDGSTKTGFVTADVKGTASTDNIYANPWVAYDDGQWHWFAMKVENQILDLFIDGRLMYRGTAIAYGTGTNADTFKNPVLGMNFMGALDDIAFFDEALSVEVSSTFTVNGWNITGGDMLTLWQQGPLAVPEPATILMMSIAAVLIRRKRK